MILTDTKNRVLFYSLKTGAQKGRVFGGYATVSEVSRLLCVENEMGKIAIYDLDTMEKREEFSFSSPISMLRFSRDGRRLFVLTSGQTIYILDVSSLARPYNARHPGNSKNLRREEKCLDFHYLDLCR